MKEIYSKVIKRILQNLHFGKYHQVLMRTHIRFHSFLYENYENEKDDEETNI
jgi:hypothetical protein